MVNQKFKKTLCELYNYRCELCKKEFPLNELEIHRIRRGNIGGKYEPRNCMCLCKACHRLIHGREFT